MCPICPTLRPSLELQENINFLTNISQAMKEEGRVAELELDPYH